MLSTVKSPFPKNRRSRGVAGTRLSPAAAPGDAALHDGGSGGRPRDRSPPQVVIVVSNSSPLITLTRAGQLVLLRQLFGRIHMDRHILNRGLAISGLVTPLMFDGKQAKGTARGLPPILLSPWRGLFPRFGKFTRLRVSTPDALSRLKTLPTDPTRLVLLFAPACGMVAP
jgi:hypothetical protein